MQPVIPVATLPPAGSAAAVASCAGRWPTVLLHHCLFAYLSIPQLATAVALNRHWCTAVREEPTRKRSWIVPGHDITPLLAAMPASTSPLLRHVRTLVLAEDSCVLNFVPAPHALSRTGSLRSASIAWFDSWVPGFHEALTAVSRCSTLREISLKYNDGSSSATAEVVNRFLYPGHNMQQLKRINWECAYVEPVLLCGTRCIPPFPAARGYAGAVGRLVCL
jgi:hypothetical protein